MKRIINQQAQREEVISKQKKLREQIAKYELEIAQLEAKRDATIHPWLRFSPFIIRSFLAVVIVGFIIRYLVSCSGQGVLEPLNNILTYLGGGAVIIFFLRVIFIPGKGKAFFGGFIPIPKDDYVKAKRSKWEKKNERYGEVKRELENLKRQDEVLEEQLGATSLSTHA